MPTTEPTERVLEELRVALFRSKLNQKTVARNVGYSTSAVSRKLGGTVPLTLDDLNTFAAAAGYEVEVRLVPRSDTSVAA